VFELPIYVLILTLCRTLDSLGEILQTPSFQQGAAVGEVLGMGSMEALRKVYTPSTPSSRKRRWGRGGSVVTKGAFRYDAFKKISDQNKCLNQADGQAGSCGYLRH